MNPADQDIEELKDEIVNDYVTPSPGDLNGLLGVETPEG